MIETFRHKIGENFVLIQDVPEFNLLIKRVSDERIFNFEAKVFETIPAGALQDQVIAPYVISSTSLVTTPGLQQVKVDFLPHTIADLMFHLYAKTEEKTLIKYERHVYGGYSNPATKLCVVFGTLIDPSGRPIQGARVEAFLNKSGFFIDKTPLVGPTANALTDEQGYFELPLLQGANVTINVPEIALNTKGYVPLVSAIELTPYCLLTERR